MRYCQLVMGPAGSGKSTYCATMQEHLANVGRSVHVVNLDPAAEEIRYTPSVDIRELITLEEVMQEYELGPNGGLIYCIEYLMDNLDWMEEEIGGYDDDYLIVDCPGQIEIYTHFPLIRRLSDFLKRLDFAVCGVYLCDSTFVQDTGKYFAGILTALSTMISLEIPHINVLSKVDLLGKRAKKREMEKFYEAHTWDLIEDPTLRMPSKYLILNKSLANVIEDYGMVQFLPLDITDEDSIGMILAQADNAMQYGEHEEPKESKDLREPTNADDSN